jgi:hypothetical protein
MDTDELDEFSSLLGNIASKMKDKDEIRKAVCLTDPLHIVCGVPNGRYGTLQQQEYIAITIGHKLFNDKMLKGRVVHMLKGQLENQTQDLGGKATLVRRGMIQRWLTVVEANGLIKYETQGDMSMRDMIVLFSDYIINTKRYVLALMDHEYELATKLKDQINESRDRIQPLVEHMTDSVINSERDKRQKDDLITAIVGLCGGIMPSLACVPGNISIDKVTILEVNKVDDEYDTSHNS